MSPVEMTAEAGAESLLSEIAEFFDVDVGFITGDSDASTPEKVTYQIDLVRSMRAAKVKAYATHTLGDLSSETLQAIMFSGVVG